MNIQVLIAFFCYFSILLGIGFLTRNKNPTAADFLMGNRSLSFWLTALSAHASDMSAWLFMAFPMAIFVAGLSQSWIAFGLILGMFINWHVVAPKLRVVTEKYNSYTLSSYFENRYQDHTGIIRLLTATMTLLFMAHYLSAGLIAMGYLFESIFNIDYYVGITVATLVVVIYVFLGGFVTVAWTDLFQGCFLLVMILLVPFVAFSHISGVDDIISIANKRNISLNFIPDLSFDTLFTIFNLTVGWGLGYFGQPHILTKFMGIRSADEMYKAKYLGMSWQTLALAGAAIVGLVGIAFFDGQLEKPELVFVEMVKQLFHPFLGGFILCAVLAANMSTMDSQILVSASVLSEDFYKHFFRKRKATSKGILRATRFGIIAMALVSLILAYNKSATIMDTVAYSWSGLGSSFGPLILMSLYSPSTNRYGAIAGIVVGGVVAAFWPILNDTFIDVTIFPLIPAFFLSLLSIFVVSKLTRRTNNSKKEYDY